MDRNTFCQTCRKEFFKASNLRRHVKKFHPDAFKEQPKKQFAFTCAICKKNFSFRRNYKFHLKTHDPNPAPTKVMKRCPLCSFDAEKTELLEHFEKIHGVQLITEKLEFQDSDSFMKWKMKLQKDTKCHFVLNYSQPTKYYSKVNQYVCHRSGCNLKSEGTKKIRGNSTHKISGFCPASIKMMTKDDCSVLVSFSKTHVGHNDSVNDNQKATPKKLKIIQLRHEKSINLSKDDLVKSDDVWHFQSNNKEDCIISVNENQCNSKCPVYCPDCKVCIHKYSCSCKDWVLKSNMCVHIHLLCRLIQGEEGKEQDIVPQPSNTSVDITELIMYDGPEERDNRPKTPIIIEEIQPEIPIEEKNTVLQEFSNILIKCNSMSLFQEIVSMVGSLKARLECEDILTPTQTFIPR